MQMNNSFQLKLWKNFMCIVLNPFKWNGFTTTTTKWHLFSSGLIFFRIQGVAQTDQKYSFNVSYFAFHTLELQLFSKRKKNKLGTTEKVRNEPNVIYFYMFLSFVCVRSILVINNKHTWLSKFVQYYRDFVIIEIW